MTEIIVYSNIGSYSGIGVWRQLLLHQRMLKLAMTNRSAVTNTFTKQNEAICPPKS